jgi:AcrR family transcriptional regulator
MQQKAPRRTRERILELSLRLFNEFGEPNITTTVIAEEMNISPGNLYYHFRNKDDIVNSIFAQFEAEIGRMLTVPAGRRSNLEDVWLYLRMMFELIWRYRFFYRDLNDMVVVATYWLSYEYVRNPRKYSEQQAIADALARGCYQVLSMLGPYLRGETHELFQRLSDDYLKQLPPEGKS